MGGSARFLASKVAPLRISVDPSAPERVNLLIPTIDVRHFFGGYIAKLNLARRLAEHGMRVRLLAVDPTLELPRDWRERVQSFRGLEGLFESVEIEFARDDPEPTAVNPADAFIATTWWTAHIAKHALGERERFLYLIQEFEPFTFPMGSFAALARESYEPPHFALFSSELLRDYFRRHRIGAYAAGAEAGDAASLGFENAITPVPPPSAEELRGRSSRRLLFYARQEPHASRNMFEIGLLALAELGDGPQLDGWELWGIGSVDGQREQSLGNGRALRILPRQSQEEYAQTLRGFDVGLALMYTPHPSLVPIEMASAGMLVVTNSCENKTAEAMRAISESIDAVRPTVESVTEGLREAIERVGDHEARARGAAVSWSRDWDASFDDELIARVISFLRNT